MVAIYTCGIVNGSHCDILHYYMLSLLLMLIGECICTYFIDSIIRKKITYMKNTKHRKYKIKAHIHKETRNKKNMKQNTKLNVT